MHDVDTPAAEATSPRIESESSLLRFVPDLYHVALLAILGAILIVALAPRLDPDMWWHMKVGEYIAMHHAVPSHDYMSFTFRGHAWTDHEWLAELAMFGLSGVAGLWGPIVAFALLICGTFYVVYISMIERAVHPVLALFVTAAAFMASSASWGPRIQMVTLSFAAVYSLALQRFELTRNRRLLFIFPALMLLWTNLHAGFVVGLAILGITVAGVALNLLSKQNQSLVWSDVRALAWTLAATFAITMVNPNTYRQLLYPLTFVLPNAYTNLIEESASPNFHTPVIMVFEVMLLLLVAAVFIGHPRLNWTHVFLVLAFTHLAFSQARNVALWAVLISPLLAVFVQRVGPILRHQFAWPSYRRRPVERRRGQIFNLVLLVLTSVLYVGEATRYIGPAAIASAERDGYPVGAARYLRTHLLPSRMYVSYTWSGYFLWKFSPAYSDFMDSRADTLYNSQVLNGYLDIYRASPDWKTVVHRYNVQDVLVEPTAPIARVLAQDSAWRLAYSDTSSVLFTMRRA